MSDSLEWLPMSDIIWSTCGCGSHRKHYGFEQPPYAPENTGEKTGAKKGEFLVTKLMVGERLQYNAYTILVIRWMLSWVQFYFIDYIDCLHGSKIGTVIPTLGFEIFVFGRRLFGLLAFSCFGIRACRMLAFGFRAFVWALVALVGFIRSMFDSVSKITFTICTANQITTVSSCTDKLRFVDILVSNFTSWHWNSLKIPWIE